jgi:hypothetical protein
MTTYSHNADATRQFSVIASEACTELFGAYGLEINSSSTLDRSGDELLFCGVMGFVGRTVRGICLLGATRPPLEQCCPADDNLRDWMGELTNQLVGRIKNKLLARGVEIALTSPVVLKGEHIAPVPRRALNPEVFSPESGNVLLWVEIETAPDFLLESAATSDGNPKEGDAFFF